MRGCGKTTIGRILAEELNKHFVETDYLITQKVGMSIPEIVKKHGWDYFRKEESEIAQEVSELTNAVISTGGGVILNQKNVESLKTKGKLIYLKATVETLLTRIGVDPNRPALTDKKNLKEELEQLLLERKGLYEQAADEIIETDDLTVDEVVDQIMESSVMARKNDGIKELVR